MKTVQILLLVLGLIIGSVVGYYVFKRFGKETPISFYAEKIKDITEFHTVKYESNYLYYGYKNDKPKKKLLSIIEIPIEVGIFFDMSKSIIHYSSKDSKMEKVVLPEPEYTRVFFDIQNSRPVPINRTRIIWKKDPESKFYQDLQEKLKKTEKHLIRRLDTLKVKSRAKKNLKTYVFTLLQNFQQERFDIVFEKDNSDLPPPPAPPILNEKTSVVLQNKNDTIQIMDWQLLELDSVPFEAYENIYFSDFEN
ncbi:DUF4230 domain-containing protein [Flagellimonas algicola]|uniref:DUF4230 domain-containing protein n=1 Tax=Flagellimonas algicola TaxID=2583815 RepID=A0ABY2WIC8_9FLAO|nr:DUF4230 domain-containing protein [Allomuricauda algicola]TMU54584.1 DUF4230 domain-containing protein [Allomuricauda algicola]